MRPNKVLVTLIFILFFLIYVTSSSGHFDHLDGIAYFFITETMAIKHTLQLYPELPAVQILSDTTSMEPNPSNSCRVCEVSKVEPIYILRSLLAPAIALPFYYIAIILSVSPMDVVALFANSFIMSLIGVVVFCFSLELYKSKKVAFGLTLIFGVCSFIWPYNSSLMSEPSRALCIFASAYFIYLSVRQKKTEKRVASSNTRVPATVSTVGDYLHRKHKNESSRMYFAALGGLFLGLSVVSHPSSIVIIPGFLGYFVFSIRRMNSRKIVLLSFLVVLSCVLILAGFTNFIRFGSFTEFGYGGQIESLSTHSGWIGLIGSLISPGKGLIFYFPLAILLPISLRYMYSEHKEIFFICVYTIVSFWLFFGSLHFEHTKLPHSETWSGGWWGPRFLVVVLPFITITLGTLFEHLRGNKLVRVLKISAIIILGIAGFSVNLLGVLVWWWYANVYWMPGEYRDYAINKERVERPYETRTWNPYQSFIGRHVMILLSGYVSDVQPVKYSYTSYSLAPCPYDNYIYCKFGILPILALSTTISIVAILIILKISNYKHPLSNYKRVPLE